MMKLDEELISHADDDEFYGYGEKQSLSESEVKGAIERIKSYRGVYFKVSAPGRLTLFGEYGDFYGKSALVTSINKRTCLQFIENKLSNLFVIRMKNISFDYHCHFSDLIKFVEEDILGYDLKPLVVPIYNPDDICHERYVDILNANFEKNIPPPFCRANEEQIRSFYVFLYLLHGIFYKEISQFTRTDSNCFSSMIINITSDIPLRAGVGSSASFSVCIAAALLYYRNIKIHGPDSAKSVTFSGKGLELISRWASKAEKILHGHGQSSKLDSVVATFGSFVGVETIDSVMKYFTLPCPPKEMNVVLIDSGVKRSTFELINSVFAGNTLKQMPLQKILETFNLVCKEASELFIEIGGSEDNGLLMVSPKFQHLVDLVKRDQEMLYSLGVSHPRIEEICSICSQHDLYSKLSGAGNGGCAFMFVPSDFDDDALQSCLNSLKDSGFEIYDVELGDKGVTVDYFTCG